MALSKVTEVPKALVDLAGLLNGNDRLALPFVRWFLWKLLGSKANYDFFLHGNPVSRDAISALLELSDQNLLQRCISILMDSARYARGIGYSWPADSLLYQFGCETEQRTLEGIPRILIASSAAPLICPEIFAPNARARAMIFEDAVRGASAVVAATERCAEDLSIYCRGLEPLLLPLATVDAECRSDQPRPPAGRRPCVTIICSPGLDEQLLSLGPLSIEAFPEIELSVLGGSSSLRAELVAAKQGRTSFANVHLVVRSGWSPGQLENALQRSDAVVLLSYYDELEFLEPDARKCGASVLCLSCEIDRTGRAAAVFARSGRHGISLAEWLAESLSGPRAASADGQTGLPAGWLYDVEASIAMAGTRARTEAGL